MKRWVGSFATVALVASGGAFGGAASSHASDPDPNSGSHRRVLTDRSVATPATDYVKTGEYTLDDDVRKRLAFAFSTVGLLPDPVTGEKTQTPEEQRATDQTRPGLAGPAKATLPI